MIAGYALIAVAPVIAKRLTLALVPNAVPGTVVLVIGRNMMSSWEERLVTEYPHFYTWRGFSVPKESFEGLMRERWTTRKEEMKVFLLNTLSRALASTIAGVLLLLVYHWLK